MRPEEIPGVYAENAAPRMLSISAGGVKGMFAFTILRRLIKDVPRVRFQVIVGSSVGALLGAMVAIDAIHKFHEDVIQGMIHSLFEDRNGRGQSILRPMFTGRNKRDAMFRVFGNTSLGDVWELHKCHLMILADNTEACGPTVFSSRDPLHAKLLLIDLVDASTAIPGIFPGVSIGNLGVFTDGGTIARDPVSVAYLLLLEQYHSEDITTVNVHKLRLLELGTTPSATVFSTHLDVSNRTRQRGLAHILSPRTIFHFVSSCSAVTNASVYRILGARRMRISTTCDQSSIDTSVMPILRSAADIIYRENRLALFRFLQIEIHNKVHKD